MTLMASGPRSRWRGLPCGLRKGGILLFPLKVIERKGEILRLDIVIFSMSGFGQNNSQQSETFYARLAELMRRSVRREAESYKGLDSALSNLISPGIAIGRVVAECLKFLKSKVLSSLQLRKPSFFPTYGRLEVGAPSRLKALTPMSCRG